MAMPHQSIAGAKGPKCRIEAKPVGIAKPNGANTQEQNGKWNKNAAQNNTGTDPMLWVLGDE